MFKAKLSYKLSLVSKKIIFIRMVECFTSVNIMACDIISLIQIFLLQYKIKKIIMFIQRFSYKTIKFPMCYILYLCGWILLYFFENIYSTSKNTIVTISCIIAVYCSSLKSHDSVLTVVKELYKFKFKSYQNDLRKYCLLLQLIF